MDNGPRRGPEPEPWSGGASGGPDGLVGADRVGALAFGALALGAFAIGRLVVRSLKLGRGEIRSLKIADLEVGTLRVGCITRSDAPEK